jgi:hypothetical protein
MQWYARDRLNTINILQIALSLQHISIKHINIKINVYFWQLGFQKGDNLNTNRTHPLYNKCFSLFHCGILWESVEFKVILHHNIMNFLDYIFLLNMPLNLTKINCITLKIRSKAEFISKSQNIYINKTYQHKNKCLLLTARFPKGR